MEKETVIVALSRNGEGNLEAVVNVPVNLGKVYESNVLRADGLKVMFMPPSIEGYLMKGILGAIIGISQNTEEYGFTEIESKVKEYVTDYAGLWFKSQVLDMELDQLELKDGKLIGFKESIEVVPVTGNVIHVPLTITDEQINDIVSTAFEGGINYWCSKSEVIGGDYLGCNYGSEVISKGGKILLHEVEDDHVDNEEEYTLTKEKVLAGIQLFVEKGFTQDDHIKLDLENYDANDADLIVQYGLFGKLVFG